ncbi:hypothetical protein GGD67_003503 [Bradyrhizobium sp. IAR9]|nr:hypothetical protein [Bradyrhizobium sp. IAR9]
MTNEQTPEPTRRSPFNAIRGIDYTVIFVRDMAAMRRFYEDVLVFPLLREPSPNWIEYGLGGNTLALARPSRTAADAPTNSFGRALRWCRRRPTSRSGIARCSSATPTAIFWRSMPRFRLCTH